MDWHRFTDIFIDPFYYGVLLQEGKTVDLRDIPGYDFTPAVIEEDWQAVQALVGVRRNAIKPEEHKTFFPLRGMVLCSFCNKAMYVGAPTSSKKKRYLNYRNDNIDCTRIKRAIRGKVVLNHIYDFLKNGLNFSEEDYRYYATDLTVINDGKRKVLQVNLHSSQGAHKPIVREIDTISLNIVRYPEDSSI